MILVLIDSKLFLEILSMSFHICQEMKNESFKRRHCKEWERTTFSILLFLVSLPQSFFPQRYSKLATKKFDFYSCKDKKNVPQIICSSPKSFAVEDAGAVPTGSVFRKLTIFILFIYLFLSLTETIF